MIFALLFLWLLFGLMTKNMSFLTPDNISNLFRQMTIISFLAIGMEIVIVTGNIDLSVGSAAGLVCVVNAYVQVEVLPNMLQGIIPGRQGEA